jgi:hypothetical protein
MPTKKTKKPAPPKNTRMDIILDPYRQEILKKLEASTGLKTNTKILFHCAEFYLNDKSRMETRINDQSNEIRKLKRDLDNAKEYMSHFVSALDSMKSFCNNTLTEDREESEGAYTFCDSCGHKCNADDIEEGECPQCRDSI